MLANHVDTLLRTGRNRKLDLKFKTAWNFGCSVTLAGYGYPYVQQKGPPLPVETTAPFDVGCDVWWNEVTRDAAGRLFSTGHRIADVVAFGAHLPEAICRAYDNIKKIRSLASYYRTDVGQSMWPPGSE
jgi:phosphoribosylamine-glycine ligase